MNLTANQEIYLILAIVFILFVLLIFFLRRFKNYRPIEVDELDGHDFEYYCADLLRSCGFMDIEVTKGSGDYGADILCERNGISYAIQCKCYDKDIGVHAIQEVYAAKDYYDCMVGVVMCNQYFTTPAVKMASKLNVLLWDRDYLAMMNQNLNSHDKGIRKRA